MRAGQLQRAFGEALREARVRRGLTQESLAFDAGYDRTAVSLLERGLRTPSLATVVDLAEALAMTPMELIAQTLEQTRRAGRRPR